MDEKLSQSQIDDLLKAFSSPGGSENIAAVPEPTSNVKEYDFRAPQKFSKEQLGSTKCGEFLDQLMTY